MKMEQVRRKRKPLTQLTMSESNYVPKRSKSEEVQPFQRRVGTITYMILRNFMCHSLLEVKFNSNINIVIGRNGSGKSAILTALIVGLGGKANITNRGNSVKGFIKAGKTSGSIEIQLYNEGLMAYRPTVYGKRITIVRNFNASGGSNYRIKSERGETVSTKADEIKLILTSFNIQIDNPVCILTQDTSRNFLSSNNPKHKFTLFMKATRLETLDEEFRKIQRNRVQSVRLLEEKTENFTKMKDELKNLKRKIDGHKSIAALRERLKVLQTELIWSKVQDVEEEMNHMSLTVEKLDKKLSDVENNRGNRSRKLAALKEEVKDLEHQVAEIKDTIEIRSRPIKDIQIVLQKLRDKHNEKRKNKSLLAQTIKSKSEDAEGLQREIDNAHDKMTKVEKEKVERLRNLSKMEEKLKGMGEHLQTSKNDLFQLKSDLDRQEEEDKNLRREITQLDQKILNDKNNLNALEKETGNTLLMYGHNMPKVVDMIERNEKKFVHKPRGPLGAYIKLKDKKWGVAVEGYLSPAILSAFTVDNKKDNELLCKIFDQCYGNSKRPMIVNSKFIFLKHKVAPNLVKAPSGCVGLFELLEIEDPVVFNCIVDQANIEGVLLALDDKKAMELMSNQANVPQNCTQTVTIKGNKYYPDPDYKTYASNYHRAQFLQVDTSDYIRELKNNIQNYMEAKRALETQYSTFKENIKQKMERKMLLEERIKKITSARTQIRVQLEELRSSAELEVVNAEVLEAELNEIKSTLNEKQGEMGQIEEELKNIKMQVNENELKLGKFKKEVENLEERFQSIKEDIKRNIVRQQELSTTDEYEKRTIAELQGKLRHARSEKIEKETEVQKQTEVAVLIGERPRILRDVPTVAADIKELERTMRKQENESENINDVIQRYTTLNEKYKRVSELMFSLKADVEELTLASNMRTRHYKLTESYFVTFIKHSFKKMLEVRQFKGSININMDRKELELIVIPQQGSQGLTTTSNLSGGERSFSTVAFLYSLWQCMEFPFYFLDEFDVYMDKLNRSKVIDILLHHADNHPQLQFVFLTPQDVSFINKNVDIFRMEDPVRFNSQP